MGCAKIEIASLKAKKIMLVLKVLCSQEFSVEDLFNCAFTASSALSIIVRSLIRYSFKLKHPQKYFGLV